MDKKMKVAIPMTPNFIRVGDNFISIKEFDENELIEIGREWTKELIKKSKK